MRRAKHLPQLGYGRDRLVDTGLPADRRLVAVATVVVPVREHRVADEPLWGAPVFGRQLEPAVARVRPAARVVFLCLRVDERDVRRPLLGSRRRSTSSSGCRRCRRPGLLGLHEIDVVGVAPLKSLERHREVDGQTARSCGSGNGGSGSDGDTRSSAGRALDLVVAGLAAANSLLANLEALIRSLWEQLWITVVFVTHDIDESIYLAQRVVVLSSSPTRVLSAVAVDLPTEVS